MIKIRNKIAMLALAVLSVLSFYVLAPAALSAQPDIQDGLNRGSCLNVATANCDTENPEDAMNRIITSIINILSIVVGVVSVIMIIIGGFRYVLSGGESGNVTSAKNTILFAIVGLVIVAFAQIIVRFVLQRVVEP